MIAKMDISRGDPRAGCSREYSNVQTRRYYIAAEEVTWDFLPRGENHCKNDPALGDDENVFVENGPDRIGSRYIKARYIRYTDSKFTKQMPQDPTLGYLGPTLQAEVGDTVEVVFLNRLDRAVNIEPHGLQFAAASNGPVQRGKRTTYTWTVPFGSGPAPEDGNSIVWMYHSSITEPGDQTSGLLGAVIVYNEGL